MSPASAVVLWQMEMYNMTAEWQLQYHDELLLVVDLQPAPNFQRTHKCTYDTNMLYYTGGHSHDPGL